MCSNMLISRNHIKMKAKFFIVIHILESHINYLLYLYFVLQVLFIHTYISRKDLAIGSIE